MNKRRTINGIDRCLLFKEVGGVQQLNWRCKTTVGNQDVLVVWTFHSFQAFLQLLSDFLWSDLQHPIGSRRHRPLGFNYCWFLCFISHLRHFEGLALSFMMNYLLFMFLSPSFTAHLSVTPHFLLSSSSLLKFYVLLSSLIQMYPLFPA